MVLWQSGNCGVLLILFFRGSIPLDTYLSKPFYVFLLKKWLKKIYKRVLYKTKMIFFLLNKDEHVEIGKQSPLKQEWK